jgi:O-antigen/teichoic acid export membrane protein
MADVGKLVRYSSHHFIGRVVGLALGFASFPIFTRLFSVSDYGAINLILQAVMIFTALSKAGLQNSVQRFELELTKASPVEKQKFFSTIFLGNAAIALICAAIFDLGALTLPVSVLSPSARNIALLGSLLIVSRAVRAMYGNMLQIEGRTISFNVLEVSIKAATIAAVCLFAFGWQTTSTAFFLGMALVEAGAIFVIAPELARRMGKSLNGFDFRLLRRFIVFGFPLMWAELAWVILDSGNRFIIQIFCGTTAVGYFAAAYNIGAYVQEVVLTPLNLSFFPVCMDLWTHHGEQRTKEFLRRTFSYFILFACGIVALTVVMSGDLIVILASPKYLQAHVLLPWLIAGAAACALQVFFKTGLMLQRRPAKVAHATTVAAIFNIALNLIIVPRVGILGAAVATCLSYGLWVVLMARAAHKAFPFAIEYRAVIRYIGCGVATALVTSQVHLQNTYAHLGVRSIVGMSCYAGLVLLLDKKVRSVVLQLLRQWIPAFAFSRGSKSASEIVVDNDKCSVGEPR